MKRQVGAPHAQTPCYVGTALKMKGAPFRINQPFVLSPHSPLN